MLMKKTLKITARTLADLGTVTAAQTAKTTAQWAIEQFNSAPTAFLRTNLSSEIDYELNK
jgi:hypothetical protein